MTGLGVALATLLSHYRRHPAQLVLLLLGLWVAGALWSGVQAINASARDSYARAEALFSSGLDTLERRDGAPLTRGDFVALRRAGLPVSPWLEGEIETAGGERLTLIGLDPLTLPGDGPLGSGGARLDTWLSPPWQSRVAPETLAALGLERETAPGAEPALADGRRLPPLALAPSLPPATLVTDLAAAARLLERGERLDRLVAPAGELTAAPAGYALTRAETRLSPGELTASFHLSLTAMALLALIVGLFIVQAALGLVLEQRLGLLRTLRALGVPGRHLVGLLALELCLLGLAGALAGILGGVWLARALLPDVAASLSSLYGTAVGTSLRLPWHYWLGGLGVMLGGLFLAGGGVLWRAARLPVLALGQAQAWRGRFHRQLTRQALAGAGVATVGLALWAWLAGRAPGEGLIAAFALVAALLLAGALWLPPLLAAGLAGLGRLARPWPLGHWALADLQLQLPRLALAMMALLIALSANLGVGSMVGGFRLTFLDWLDRRLVADLYLAPPPARLEALDAWLADRPEVAERLPTASGDTTLQAVDGAASGRPVELFGITPGERLTATWPLLANPDGRAPAWAALAAGEAFVNEQLAIAEGITPGSRLTLAGPDGPVRLAVAAVYPDYGNPRSQVLLATPVLHRRFDARPGGLGVVLRSGADATDLSAALADRFGGEVTVRDQREVKRLAVDVFERTFAITRALNVLTLGVAALALLASLLAQARERRRRLAPLWALGVPRGRLVGVQLAQLGGAALVTGLLALPLGVAVTACLVGEINVAAFGWRLPLHVFPGALAVTLATALGVALLAAALPAAGLWRTPPRTLLAEEDTP